MPGATSRRACRAGALGLGALLFGHFSTKNAPTHTQPPVRAHQAGTRVGSLHQACMYPWLLLQLQSTHNQNLTDECAGMLYTLFCSKLMMDFYYLIQNILTRSAVSSATLGSNYSSVTWYKNNNAWTSSRWSLSVFVVNKEA